MIIEVKYLTKKKRILKIIDRGPYLEGFPAMRIMNLWGMLFHPANVLSLVFALELKSCSALCDLQVTSGPSSSSQENGPSLEVLKLPVFPPLFCLF